MQPTVWTVGFIPACAVLREVQQHHQPVHPTSWKAAHQRQWTEAGEAVPDQAGRAEYLRYEFSQSWKTHFLKFSLEVVSKHFVLNVTVSLGETDGLPARVAPCRHPFDFPSAPCLATCSEPVFVFLVYSNWSFFAHMHFRHRSHRILLHASKVPIGV